MNEPQKKGLERNRQYTEWLKREHPLQQLFWECTLRCNMACRHCGSDCKKETTSTEMPLDDFLKVLDIIAQHQNPESILVSTLGGEPLVRHDLIECGREIKKRGFDWGLVTNGYLLDENMMGQLVDAGIDSLSVDLDGNKEDHNWLRNSNSSFDHALNAIELLGKTENIEWDVITCINGRNITRLEELKKILVTAGVKHWRCFSIIPVGRAASNSELQLNDRQFVDLLNFIVTTRKEGLIDMQYACEGFLGGYEGLVRNYFYTCEAGLTVASIRANGDISGCLSIRNDYNQGNIYRDDFWDVWQNRFEKFRDRQWMKHGICSDCKVFDYCQGNGFHLRDENGDVMVCHYNRLKNIKLNKI